MKLIPKYLTGGINDIRNRSSFSTNPTDSGYDPHWLDLINDKNQLIQLRDSLYLAQALQRRNALNDLSQYNKAVTNKYFIAGLPLMIKPIILQMFGKEDVLERTANITHKRYWDVVNKLKNYEQNLANN